MLNSVYKDVLKNAEKKMEKLRGPQFSQIIEKAKKNWIEYAPKKEQVELAGIDSSFNSKKFQGLAVWAVTAVSVKSNGEILVDIHNSDIGKPKHELSEMAISIEIDACKKTVELVELVLMDGSLYSHLADKQEHVASTLNALMKRKNVVFVSKTSNSIQQFSKDNVAGDIFYYNHATVTSGFSKIYEDDFYGKNKVITTVYARLSNSLPILKIEILGNNYSEEEIKEILNKLNGYSVSGYPYSLKLAHYNCQIKNTDLSKIVKIYGLSKEIGSREVLG